MIDIKTYILFKKLFLVIFVLVLLTSCQSDRIKPFNTKEEAIDYGIVQEKIDNILAQEYIGAKTHIIFEIKDAIGTACVYESADGFVWERSSPYLVLSPSDLNDSIYVQILNLGDNNDTSFTHLVGKAYDSSAEKIIVEGDGSVHELEISSNQFFYYKSSVPLHQLQFSYK